MTEEQLRAIKARCEAATPGPWAFRSNAVGAPAVVGREVLFDGTVAAEDEDAAFIAHARQDVPALVAEVERLRALLAPVWDTNEKGGAT